MPPCRSLAGIDASDYDWSRGPMDLAAARQDGIDFFTHKATEGTWTRHSHFGEALRRARDAGIPVLGAYHVVRSPADAAAEVDYCLAYVNQQAPWWRDFPHWFWQIDLEKWPYDSVPASEGEHFADIIEERTGRKAVIYASRGQYGNELTGTSHDLWNANYGTDPTGHFRTVYQLRGGDSGPGWVTYSGRMPIFWQYGARTTIGAQGTCDANAFRGSIAELLALINPSGGPFVEGTDMLLIKIANNPAVYKSVNGEYEHLTGPGAGEALAAAQKAGYPLITVANLQELEQLAGKPKAPPQPVPVELTAAQLQQLADMVAARMPSAGQIAAAVGAREADADRARADVLDNPAQ